jgi:hypothetical protein
MEESLKENIPTTALILDYDKMQENIEFMAKFAKEKNIKLRLHLKTDDITKLKINNELVIDNHLKFYEPQVVSSLSKNGYDTYFFKKEIINEIQEKLNPPTLALISLRTFLNRHLNIAT